MRKINEIFYSIQGEGHHTGYPSVFIRFSGCNLKCPFCDTSHQEGLLMSDNDIIRAVNLYTASWIVLTGGEPTLHIDDEFVKSLKRATGKKVAIETNGTRPIPPSVDWVCVSPKTGIDKIDCSTDEILARQADEIKVVDVGQPLDPYFNLPCRTSKTLMYLQPCFVPEEKEFDKNRLHTVKRVLADPRWTLSVQIHRYLHIP
ncbi:MAG: 7-carboxy-7-deazaguanine synthase QueE [Prevotella sp.]|nr:7-carboxy-7-deazaguanine synthase QueE [Bacteroides sp.]MCM1366314.1 7-carboxy-7-deazaguanine synthase QueE [Prevotella sp.]MCM1437118.1 7-carboxy-7-deazaguanine synthase QueE [Prevotella sp.]